MKSLVGNSWPMPLFQRQATIFPITIDALKKRVCGTKVYSFWGHQNTVAAVSSLLECDITPNEARPTVVLNSTGYPTLYGEEFRVVYVVTPKIFKGSKRLYEGKALTAFDIARWTAVQITF